MLFDELSELGSYLSDGFKTDDVVSLLERDDYTDEDRIIMNYINNYFALVRQGYNLFIGNEYPRDDENDTLNAFNIFVYVLINDFGRSSLSRNNVLVELEIFEAEIGRIIETGRINTNEVENSLRLFKAVGRRLLEESYKITEEEEEFFEF